MRSTTTFIATAEVSKNVEPKKKRLQSINPLMREFLFFRF